MSKKKPYLIEMGLGIIICGVVAWAYSSKIYSFEAFSLGTYDTFSKFRKVTPKVDDIQLVGIDDESVANLGRWPWPRPIVGQLIDEVVLLGAKVIGVNIGFYDSDQNQGLEEVAVLEQEFANLLKSHRWAFKRKGISLSPFEDFKYQLAESKLNLDGDSLLALAIEESGNVILPMYFTPGEPLGNNLEPLPEFFEREKITLKPVGETFPFVPSALAATLPLENLGSLALGIGHSNLKPDIDGIVRRIAPLIQYGQSYYPSFGIQIAREYLNLQRDAFSWKPEIGFNLQKAQIPIDEEAMSFLEFSGPAGTFNIHSAIDILTGALPENTFNNKIVLIGVTATGIDGTMVVSGGERLTGLEIWATHLENILNQRFITRPPWAPQLEWGTIGLAALMIIFILPLVRARFAIPISAIFFLCLIGTSGFLFVDKGLWVSPSYGAILLLSGFAVLVGKRLVFTEKGKEIVEAEGVETNKMLGLSFQGQGMLDLSFEKFRKCPMDRSMMDLLYNLGLDMERKRMYTKAAAVYEHISVKDPKYKDIKNKIEILKKAGEGAVFGGVGKKGTDSTVVVDGLGQNTTLGRYEVIKELGRGAMGIVYLGKDPKINRQVAIKTLRFEDEITEEQMKSIKERFFREAESAGNLTHPNIIRIFDAGEDQDVAFIAMELLHGKDLKEKCEKSALLPYPRVIELIIYVADALDYAHKQGVIHRDIKPANLMLLKDSTLRITDFGIARIQATSKTATGAVLGTPAYMSPEQVNGKKVDGRSDIFSLGITLFEMLTGEKPFHADSIAALLYRIANVEHPDPREFNPHLPEKIIPVINKALAKELDKRYQTAGEMATDLRECLTSFSKEPTTEREIPLAPEPIEIIPKTIDENKQPEPEPPKKETAPVEPPKSEPSNSETSKAEPPSVNLDFYSELQDAFNIPGESKENKKEEEKTEVLNLEKKPDVEKTEILAPGQKPIEIQPEEEISVLPEIEQTCHPGTQPFIANNDSEEKKAS